MADAPNDRLQSVRAFYARMVAAGGGDISDSLERAFDSVPREDFLGPGPWQALSLPGGHYVATPDSDPIHLYQDRLFALDADKGIHNGEPNLHGQLLGALHPDPGDTVLHIGCGTGYYTAILAHLVGPKGRVIAYEIDPRLAKMASRNLKDYGRVRVIAGSGVEQILPKADRIYVNAGATHPVAAWLDAMNAGGRLVFPLSGHGPGGSWGVSLAITRGAVGWPVRVIGRSGFIGCAGANDRAEGQRVTSALTTGALWTARSLVRDDSPDATVLLAGAGWWFSSRAVA